MSRLLLLGFISSLACGLDLAPIDPLGTPCSRQVDCAPGWLCHRQFCLRANCRLDGRLVLGEACDDGNTIATDSCTDRCELARCGDGLLRTDVVLGEAGYEACDDGNQNGGDACLNNCAQARCGDGVVRADIGLGEPGYEACDDGNLNNEDECSNACQLARCGDGYRRADLEPGAQGYEACDDGNADDHDACTNACAQATCGDGIRRTDLALGDRAYESCDDGNDHEADACLTTCVRNVCGDGHHAPEQEACDDGNDAVDDGCIDCRLARCGDGYRRLDLEPEHPDYEACDDGNEVDTDACLRTCAVARCGDGVVRSDLQTRAELGFEDCEPGTYDGDEQCSTWCHEMPPAPKLAVGVGYKCVLAAGAVHCAGCVPQTLTGDDGRVEGPVSYRFEGVEGLRLGSATGMSFLCHTSIAGSGSCWDMMSGSLRRWAPVAVPEPLADVVRSISTHLSCSLARSGRVRCWSFVQPQPTLVEGMQAITRLDLAHDNFCAVDVGGTGYCWGRDLVSRRLENMPPLRFVTSKIGWMGAPMEFLDVLTRSGQVLSYRTGEAYASIPQSVVQLAGSSTGAVRCALTDVGTVYCRGWNGNAGLLGIGAGFGFFAEDYVQVPGLTGVVEIRGGNQRFCALEGSGNLWCWGVVTRTSNGRCTSQSESRPFRVPGFPVEAP